MLKFNIVAPDKAIAPALREKIDNLTKPKGSLGRLESLALQAGLIQQSLTPCLYNPVNILFAADHGIIEEGVSLSPKEVTRQQVENFLRGHGGVNFLCRQHGFSLKVVDVGVDWDFRRGLSAPEPGVVFYDRKVRKGTSNYLHGAAMSATELKKCLLVGMEMAEMSRRTGSNVVSFGELGMGNTSASSVWMHLFTGIPLVECVGAGSGFNSEQIRHKYEVLDAAVRNFKVKSPSACDTEEIIRWFGGFEMVAAIGGMLKAAELKMIILVDGFIMTACALAAARLCPAVKEYMVFGHCGDESGHRKMLEALGAEPLLNLGLRLGEGSGAICAYPILDSAVRMINEMETFRGASVTKYF